MQKKAYVPSRVLQVMNVRLEHSFLKESVVEKMNEEGILTKPQEVTNENFDNGSEYNFKWE